MTTVNTEYAYTNRCIPVSFILISQCLKGSKKDNTGSIHLFTWVDLHAHLSSIDEWVNAHDSNVFSKYAHRPEYDESLGSYEERWDFIKNVAEEIDSKVLAHDIEGAVKLANEALAITRVFNEQWWK